MVMQATSPGSSSDNPDPHLRFILPLATLILLVPHQESRQPVSSSNFTIGSCNLILTFGVLSALVAGETWKGVFVFSVSPLLLLLRLAFSSVFRRWDDTSLMSCDIWGVVISKLWSSRSHLEPHVSTSCGRRRVWSPRAALTKHHRQQLWDGKQKSPNVTQARWSAMWLRVDESGWLNVVTDMRSIQSYDRVSISPFI